ncbi:carboxylesterase [Mycolicibacter sinensis]|uniref:Carboxylesterase n=1 Tax=Mycolicibacter sinensis (strain JDM601) TaxID=875328 RepID=A0A1A3U7N3_MYCSD|nr:carboxylesterase [Mycolicibacter sinensis]
MSKRWVSAFGLTAAVLALAGCGLTVTKAGPDPLAHQAPRSTPNGMVLVSPDNFVRAVTDQEFTNVVNENGFGRFFHMRDVTPIDRQLVVRSNRDTLYSAGVFDLQAAPVTITLPDPGERYMSAQVINQDEYVTDMFYGGGEHTLDHQQVGTRYVMVVVRILADPKDPADLGAARRLQDHVTVTQEDSGSFDVPRWDPVSQKKVGDALLVLAETIPDTRGMFGTLADTDPVRHLIGAAAAWGGNPEKDALYLNVTPARNDGNTVHRLTVENVPVKAFWSVSVYNKNGYFTENPQQAYSVNDITAVKAQDGSVTVQFGGCSPNVINCLPITPGWNYLVRLYQPRQEILSGKWVFPAAQPVETAGVDTRPPPSPPATPARPPR